MTRGSIMPGPASSGRQGPYRPGPPPASKLALSSRSQGLPSKVSTDGVQTPTFAKDLSGQDLSLGHQWPPLSNHSHVGAGWRARWTNRRTARGRGLRTRRWNQDWVKMLLGPSESGRGEGHALQGGSHLFGMVTEATEISSGCFD